MASERNPLLRVSSGRKYSIQSHRDYEASSIIKSHVSIEETKMSDTSVGERLPYNDYTTIDQLHDLVN